MLHLGALQGTSGRLKKKQLLWVVSLASVGLQLLSLRVPLVHADRQAVFYHSLLDVGLNADSSAGVFSRIMVNASSAEALVVLSRGRWTAACNIWRQFHGCSGVVATQARVVHLGLCLLRS